MWGGLCMFIAFHRRFVKVENLRGIPGEEAQLSTSTVTEETDTELGRLSTLTLVGAQFGVSNQHKFLQTGPIQEFRGEFLGEFGRELDRSPWLLPPLSLYLKSRVVRI